MKNFVSCYCEPCEGESGIKGFSPVYSTMGAACADVLIPCDTDIMPFTPSKIDLWIKFDIPEGYKIVMYPRSSLLFTYGLMSPVSIIDADHKQHVHAVVFNTTNKVVKLFKGERIAQVECVPAYQCKDWEVKNVTRQGGFGSTGRI